MREVRGDMMLQDIYVLAKERSVQYAHRFIDAWAKGFEEVAIEYEFPQYSDEPKSVYLNPKDLIEQLVQDPKEPHAIYWHNPQNSIVSSAMLFFTIDGGMIAGLSVKTENVQELENYLQDLAGAVEGELGAVFYEEPPPDSVKEFKRRVILSTVPKLLPY